MHIIKQKAPTLFCIFVALVIVRRFCEGHVQGGYGWQDDTFRTMRLDALSTGTFSTSKEKVPKMPVPGRNCDSDMMIRSSNLLK